VMVGTASRRSIATVVFLLAAVTASAQPPGRDAAKPNAVGTAVLSGMITTDEQSPRPLRRVRVGITTPDRRVGRTTVTDDAGRFSFAALPAGRYMLSATKSGYVTTSFGARRPNRSGTALVLADGQRITGLTVRLPRGAVITGTITDQNGDPFSGANVSAMRYAYAGSGQRTLVGAGRGVADDRGQYRLWGLAAGEYVVSAAAEFASPALRPDVEIERSTDADVRRAIAELNSASSPGAAAGPSAAPVATSPGRTVGYATVFYPGTFASSQATAVKVAAGEERPGVDFPLMLVPTAKIEGILTVPDGLNPQSVVIQMITDSSTGFMFDLFRRSTPAPDGYFKFAGVPPGAYTIAVRGGSAGAARSAGAAARVPTATPPQPTHWAMAQVTIDGQDISGLSLTLQPGMTVSGRVLFEGTTPPPDVSRLRISLNQPQAPGTVSLVASAIQPDATGAFTIAGVAPGNYRLSAVIPTMRADTNAWQLKSATINGQDAIDIPVDLQSGTDAAVITFTDRVTEVAGTVQDSAGQPAPEYHVVVFASDRIHWTTPSRRIRSVRPAADGKFTIPNLPPGEYLIAAVNDIEPGEWYDPALLDQLSRTAIRITLVEGEKKTQDLRLSSQ
jgi:uncharacterized protein (DUF2141 family)